MSTLEEEKKQVSSNPVSSIVIPSTDSSDSDSDNDNDSGNLYKATTGFLTTPSIPSHPVSLFPPTTIPFTFVPKTPT